MGPINPFDASFKVHSIVEKSKANAAKSRRVISASRPTLKSRHTKHHSRLTPHDKHHAMMMMSTRRS
jgi:hypothetical protein